MPTDIKADNRFCICGALLKWWERCRECRSPETMEEVLRQQWHRNGRKPAALRAFLAHEARQAELLRRAAADELGDNWRKDARAFLSKLEPRHDR